MQNAVRSACRGSTKPMYKEGGKKSTWRGGGGALLVCRRCCGGGWWLHWRALVPAGRNRSRFLQRRRKALGWSCWCD